jgi:diaminohydroxyphosphoribosylaminopyrimidine deaminase/5-amino-6-(5-phosphoribosylamino)uracil reductase
VDSRLETPLDAALFIAGRACLIYAAVPNDVKQSALEALGATVVYLPGQTPGTQNKVDLKAMLLDLAQREINELHLEAGHKLNGSFIREGLVDELLVYLAPKLLGLGQGVTNLGPFTRLDEAIKLDFYSVERLGSDLRLLARLTGRERF